MFYQQPDSYCYAGSSILKNKCNVILFDEYVDMYKIYIDAKIKDFRVNPVHGKFTVTHVKNVHKALFRDLVNWAGSFRKGNFYMDEDNIHSVFCDYEEISSRLQDLLLLFDEYSSDRVELVSNVSKILSAFYNIHPFRQGNFEVIRELLMLWFKYNNSTYTLNLDEYSEDFIELVCVQQVDNPAIAQIVIEKSVS
ncbi:MAG: Fic family protein [Endomicrobium sp.]|jgi:cell filamentation protein|nr:Fic family protein [Endomicrobium sp.]